MVFVTAEREFRYRNIEDNQAFEALFNETYLINYRSHNIKEQVFQKVISFLQPEEEFPADIKEGSKDAFLQDKRKSLAECTFTVIKYLKVMGQLKGYNFDWDDWEHFARDSAPNLRRLYLVMSTFYQFGYSLHMEFCAGLLNDVDSIDINTALGESHNLPSI